MKTKGHSLKVITYLLLFLPIVFNSCEKQWCWYCDCSINADRIVCDRDEMQKLELWSGCDCKVYRGIRSGPIYSPNDTTYCVQFSADQSLVNTFNPDGSPAYMVTTIKIILLGAPQSSDITVTLSKNNSSTIGDNMWTLSSGTITIPAGSTSGTTVLTGKTSEMIEDETVTLVLDMDAGGYEAPTQNQITISMTRIKLND